MEKYILKFNLEKISHHYILIINSCIFHLVIYNARSNSMFTLNKVNSVHSYENSDGNIHSKRQHSKTK